jgi:hypothetical protein
MTDIDALINRVAYRFLQWRLPENFQPDAGINFEPDFNVGTPWPMKHRPTGTNLFSFTQAEAMVKAIAGPEIEALLDALTTERAKVAALEAEVKIAEAKGWRDAVWCLQYCGANWFQDCRPEEERKALENAARELANELVTCSPGDWLGTEWNTAQDYISAITKLEAQVDQLIDERDDAQEALSRAYYLVTGRSPEWSNLFGAPECLEEIDDAQNVLRKSLSRIAALEAMVPKDIPPSVYKAVERVLDENSAWIARPNVEVTKRVALASGIAWQLHHAPQIDNLENRIEQLEAEAARWREAKAEPVAWAYINPDGECEQIAWGPVYDDPHVTPLYASPLPPAQVRDIPEGWQPIETAPRDGTEILGAFFRQPWAGSHRTGDVVKCWWQPQFEAFISSARIMSVAPGYTFDDGETERYHSPVIEKVSHWMPLPAPPAPETP